MSQLAGGGGDDDGQEELHGAKERLDEKEV